MPKLAGTVSELIKKRDGTVFGIKTDKGEFLYSWPDKREEPFEDGRVKVGSMVEGTWMPFEKDGKTIRYLSILSVTGEDVSPDRNAFDEEIDKPSDGQYRSPKDFRRTSALAQAVAFLATAPDADVEEVVRVAQRLEIFLASGL